MLCFEQKNVPAGISTFCSMFEYKINDNQHDQLINQSVLDVHCWIVLITPLNLGSWLFLLYRSFNMHRSFDLKCSPQHNESIYLLMMKQKLVRVNPSSYTKALRKLNWTLLYTQVPCRDTINCFPKILQDIDPNFN